MDTVYSFAHVRPDGSSVTFDFVAGADVVGWYRHEFTPIGAYRSVSHVHVRALRAELGAEPPDPYLVELRSAAAALAAAAEGMRAQAAAAVSTGRLDHAARLTRRAGEVDMQRGQVLDDLATLGEDRRRRADRRWI